MKIVGDDLANVFTDYAKEPGTIFGSNDVLKGPSHTVYLYQATVWGTSEHIETIAPKLYLHIPTNAWTTFTGKLREYLLPWGWKTAYLDQENGNEPRRILAWASTNDDALSRRINKLLGKSLFVANLINVNQYDEIFGQEFIRLRGTEDPLQDTDNPVQGLDSLRTIIIEHPLGAIVGEHLENTKDSLCHIYTARNLFSKIKYNLLKHTLSWKEVAIQADNISEKVLIKRTDEEAISRAGLLA